MTEIEQHLEFLRWSSGSALLVGVAVLSVLLAAVYRIYRAETSGTVGRAMTGMLICLRVCVLLLLAAIMLEPVLTPYVRHRTEAVTLVLVDESASMSLADQYNGSAEAARVRRLTGAVNEGETRAALCEYIVNDAAGGLIRRLTANNGVRVFGFAESPIQKRHIARAGEASPEVVSASSQSDVGGTADKESASLAFKANGAVTDLGRAVRGSLASLGDLPIAALVLLSDGGINRGESADTITRILDAKAISLYAVGIGSPIAPANLAIEDIEVPRTVFLGDPFTVFARLRTSSVGAADVEVSLIEDARASGGGFGVVETKRIRLEADDAPSQVFFERRIDKPGPVLFSVRAEPLAEEVVQTDNEARAVEPVRVLDKKTRVLLVSAAPTYDYRFVARLLERDNTIDLSTWLQSADAGAVRDGNTIIDELPTTKSALAAYDVVLLMDCNATRLSQGWSDLLADLVSSEGLGVLYQAGNKYSSRFFQSPKTQAISRLLPVVPDPDAEILLNDLGHYQMRAWPFLIPADAVSDPIIRCSPDPALTRAIWSALSGVYWHYPVRKEKPAAQVLMRHSNPRMANNFGGHVLLATQYVGAGRSAYLAFDSTWRWRRNGEAHFERFWIRLLRFLSEGRLFGTRRHIQVETEKMRFEPGEAIVLRVRALNDVFEPLIAPAFSLIVRKDAAEALMTAPADTNESDVLVNLAPIVGREGYYQGQFNATEEGVYSVWPAEMGTAEAADARENEPLTRIVVAGPDIEMRDPAMKRDALRSLAEATGGRYFDIDESAALAEAIPDRSRERVERDRPVPLWDNGYVFAAMMVLLGAEWIVRKRAGLL